MRVSNAIATALLLLTFVVGARAIGSCLDLTPVHYPTGGHTPAAVAIGDFNGDGKPDLAVTNYASGNLSILLGVGDGTFSAPVMTTVATHPMAVVTGYFNDDRFADLAVTDLNWAVVAPR